MYDVVVIGSGPIGSRVACRLVENGLMVAVLERHARIGEKLCCSGIVSHECVKAFNISDDVILRKVNSASIYSPSGNLIRVSRKETQAYILDRSAFDRLMADRARSKGVRYYLSTGAQGIDFKSDKAIVSTENGNFEAKATVIASGLASSLIKRIGWRRPGRFAGGAQAVVEIRGIEEVEVYFGQELAPGYFGWLIPTSPGKGIAGLLSRKSPGLYLRKFLSRLYSQGKIASTDVIINHGGIPVKPLSRTYADRLLVVGDAAGQVKPTTGGGIYFGLLAADIAANTLIQALKADDLSAENLSGYQKGWKKKLQRELTVEYYSRMIYQHLNDRQIDRIFNMVRSHHLEKELLKSSNLAFDWHGEAMLSILKQSSMTLVPGLLRFPFVSSGKKTS